MRSIPPVKVVMTPFPYWVEKGAALEEAVKLMQENDIRHLPVKDHGVVFGVITDRDINRAIAHAEETHKNPKTLLVEDLTVRQAYIVGMDEPLDNVLLHMAEHHIGSVVVTKGDRLAGVFTSNDVCRYFAEFLRYHFRPGGGGDAA